MKSIYSKVYKDIISRMKKARKEAGFTQKDVADKLRVTQPYISKIEACQLRVDIVQLKKFAELYGKPLNFLLEDAQGGALALAEEREGYSASGPGTGILRDPMDSVNFAVRDPLNAVIGLSELLLKTELSQEQKRFVRDIEASSDELLRHVKEIVGFSKLESGRISPAVMEFDLKETVEQVVRAAQSRAAAAGLDIMCFVDPNIPQRLSSDQYCIHEMLYNLFAAALDTADPCGTVSISVERMPEGSSLLSKPQEGRQQLQFHIRGFRPEEGVCARTVSGGGLGLEVSKALVEKLGGVFWMDTAHADHACDFRFTLPLEPVQDSVPSPQAQFFKGRKVLLVTADRERRRIFSALFASWGMEAVWAEDAEGAEKALAQGRADLLVGDAPAGEQCPQFCDRLRRQASQKDTKALFLASAAQAGKLEKADAVLVRPVCQNMLFDALSRLFSAAKGKAPHEGKKQRVLLVEDNPVTAKLISYMLSEAGFALDLASSGEAAVGAASDKDYDAVLMDLRLPEMDGCAAAERIISERRQNGKKPVPVIGISADDTSEARSSAEKSGMAAFVAKPLRAAALSAILKRHIQKAKA